MSRRRKPPLAAPALGLAAGLAVGLAVAGLDLAWGQDAAVPVEGEVLDVAITSPPPGEPQFGEVEITADVYPPENAARVEFFVDGKLVGEVASPPFSLRVDVGEENREHRFEVKVTSRTQQTRDALLVSPSIRVDGEVVAELQQLYLTVSRGEERVLDLTQDDFTIFDNGDRQEMVTFARGDARLVAAILIDSSASMKGERLRYALRGASAFVGGLASIDDASILLFSDRLLHATPFSHDLAELTAGLGAVRAAGGTALNDHFYRALKELEYEQGRRVVILLSDGIDSHSALRMSEVNWLARRSRALVYWLRTAPRSDGQKTRSSAWKSPAGYQAEYQQLTRTVLETGGRILTLERIQDAESAFRDILRELREQYVLGYYPTLSRGDESWHRVSVRVRQGGLQVRTRGGYVDY